MSSAEDQISGGGQLPLVTDSFSEIRRQAVAAGGFCLDLTHHVICYLPVSGRRLAVTFDNLASRRETENRLPWGHGFLTAEGWDVMGVMVKRQDWFRHPDVWETFDRLKAEGFFARFQHVAMYGASMGAYGALTFAPAAPGCTVLAFAPQSSLDPRKAPFETRYRYGRKLGDWDGAYSDAAEGIRAAGKVYIGFDPWQKLDAAHAARLAGPQVIFLRTRGSGHKVPPALQKMGLLKLISKQALDGTLSGDEFNRAYRARRLSPLWQINLIERARERGHKLLALRAVRCALRSTQHHKLRQLRKSLLAECFAINSGSDPT